MDRTGCNRSLEQCFCLIDVDCFRALLWCDNLAGDLCNWVVRGHPQSPPQVNAHRQLDDDHCGHLGQLGDDHDDQPPPQGDARD